MITSGATEDGEQITLPEHRHHSQGGSLERKRRRDSQEDTSVAKLRDLLKKAQQRERESQQKVDAKEQKFEQRTVQRSGKVLVRSINQNPTLETFTLFSDEDNGNPEWADHMPAESEHDFTVYMRNYLETYILQPSREEEGLATKLEYNSVRIAILDTGFYDDGEDDFFQGAESRIKLKKNFAGSDTEDCRDYHGHGTHVTRLLLRFAPEADIYIAKISESRLLEKRKMDQLVRALHWAGEHADIISLSFGLGYRPPSATSNIDLMNEIDCLVGRRKLIFAAASNTGGNGSRPWPALHNGVFCIHATDERGVPNLRMNPTALGKEEDNFATLGESIKSYWNGKPRCISGTSFATPIAAAIAANVLEFARRHLVREDADMLLRYGVMRILFRNHMTENSDSGVFHCIKPWRIGLWEAGADPKDIIRKLQQLTIMLQ